MSQPSEQDDAVRRLARLLRSRLIPDKGPLSPEQQAQFNYDWSILTPDQLRYLARRITGNGNIRGNPNMTMDQLYNSYYDYLNGVQQPDYRSERNHNHGPTLDYPSTFTLAMPFEHLSRYWTDQMFHDHTNDVFSVATEEQLRNYLVKTLHVDPKELESLDREGLIRYYNTMLINDFNWTRRRFLQHLRQSMEAESPADLLAASIGYFSLDDLVGLLDEFSIEHPAELTKEEAIDLIQSYLDLFRPKGDPRQSTHPMTMRKQA